VLREWRWARGARLWRSAAVPWVVLRAVCGAVA